MRSLSLHLEIRWGGKCGKITHYESERYHLAHCSATGIRSASSFSTCACMCVFISVYFAPFSDKTPRDRERAHIRGHVSSSDALKSAHCPQMAEIQRRASIKQFDNVRVFIKIAFDRHTRPCHRQVFDTLPTNFVPSPPTRRLLNKQTSVRHLLRASSQQS